MSKLEVFNDDTPLFLLDEEKKNIIKKINEITSSLSFFKELIRDDNANMNNVWTHMGLNEVYHTDLSKMVGFDSILTKERELRHVEIREKNTEIKKLTDLLGKEVSPEAVCGAIQKYENILRAWYESEGWDYASVSSISAYGITAELSSGMSLGKEPHLADKEIAKVFSYDNGTEKKINDGWDIYKGQFSCELLATDNNKEKFKQLFLTNFPDSAIYCFTDRINDHKGFSMRIEFHISFSDLENCYKNKCK